MCVRACVPPPAFARSASTSSLGQRDTSVNAKLGHYALLLSLFMMKWAACERASARSFMTRASCLSFLVSLAPSSCLYSRPRASSMQPADSDNNNKNIMTQARALVQHTDILGKTLLDVVESARALFSLVLFARVNVNKDKRVEFEG